MVQAIIPFLLYFYYDREPNHERYSEKEVTRQLADTLGYFFETIVD